MPKKIKIPKDQMNESTEAIFEGPDTGSLMDGFVTGQEETPEKILVRMMESDEHIFLKTDYNKPRAVTKLQAWAKYFESINCPRTSELISGYVIDYSRNRVSFRREGRKEIIKALQEIRRQRYERNRWTGRITQKEIEE